MSTNQRVRERVRERVRVLCLFVFVFACVWCACAFGVRVRVRVRSCVAGPKGSSARKRGLEDRAGSLPVRALPALLDTLPDGRGNAPGVTSATSSGDTCAPRRNTGARQAA